MAFQTDVEFVRTGAVTVAVALTLDRAVGADVAKVAAAHIWLHTSASHAALCACRHANVSENYIQYLKRLRDAFCDN